MAPERGDGLAAIEHGPSGVGARLVAARERMGWTLPEVAATLRIREPHLRAIEAGHAAELPAPAYAIGFVRSYATLLGLDPDEIARRYRDELGGEHRNTDLQFPAPVPERGVPAGAVVLLGAVIAIGAYIGWYRLSAERPAPPPVVAAPDRLIAPAVVPPVAPAPAAPTTGAPTMNASTMNAPTAGVPTVGVTANPPLQTAEREAPPNPPAAAIASLSSPTTPSAATATAPSASPSSPGGESAPEAKASANPPPPPANAPSASPPSANAPSANAPAQAGALAAAMPPPAASPSDDNHIMLRARADSWVEVHDRKGRVLLSRILHSGETWAVPNQPEGAPQLLLTTGNAGGTEIVTNGTAGPPLGNVGVVLHNYALTPPAPAASPAPPAASAAPGTTN